MLRKHVSLSVLIATMRLFSSYTLLLQLLVTLLQLVAVSLIVPPTSPPRHTAPRLLQLLRLWSVLKQGRLTVDPRGKSTSQLPLRFQIVHRCQRVAWLCSLQVEVRKAWSTTWVTRAC